MWGLIWNVCIDVSLHKLFPILDTCWVGPILILPLERRVIVQLTLRAIKWLPKYIVLQFRQTGGHSVNHSECPRFVNKNNSNLFALKYAKETLNVSPVLKIEMAQAVENILHRRQGLVYLMQSRKQGIKTPAPPLLTWFNFNLCMDK